MENSLDTFVVSKDDANVVWRHPLEKFSRDQKFHFDILMEREALF